MGKISSQVRQSKRSVKKGIVKSSTATKSGRHNSLDELTHTISSEAVSRGKRKRAIKRAKLVARKAFVETALKSRSAETSSDKYGSALGSFREMEDAVVIRDDAPEVLNKQKSGKKSKLQRGALKSSQKAKSDSIDIQRVKTLLNVPEFASDPIGAIERHLVNVKNRIESKEARRKISKNEMVIS